MNDFKEKVEAEEDFTVRGCQLLYNTEIPHLQIIMIIRT